MRMAGVAVLSRVGRFDRSCHGLAKPPPILQTAPQCLTAERRTAWGEKKFRSEGRKPGYFVIQIAFTSWRWPRHSAPETNANCCCGCAG
jgi:hypothetical protein